MAKKLQFNTQLNDDRLFFQTPITVKSNVFCCVKRCCCSNACRRLERASQVHSVVRDWSAHPLSTTSVRSDITLFLHPLYADVLKECSK